MKTTNQYPNLRKEMEKRKLKISDLSNAVGVSRETMSEKLSKKRPLYLNEAEIIADVFFDNIDFRYLFASLEKTEYCCSSERR